ncbi:MAG: histidine kinase [Actinomycetota bacterium]|nr:histidine kinase [Actinomycetota bacterium]
MRFLRRLAPARSDVGLALALVALSQIEVWRYDAGGGHAAGAATQALTAALVAWRSRFPLAASVGVIAAAFLGAAVAEPGSVTLAAALIVLFYTLGTLPDRRRALAGLALGLVTGVAMTEDGSLNNYLAIVLTSFGVPWLVGTLRLRQRRARELETQREEAARLAVAEERARLARELHDVVSHDVGMIVVQAGAGDVLLDEQPERTREALRAIESGARHSLVELRRLLGLLRTDAEASLAPQPTLARLDELVERVREAGLAVQVQVEGSIVPLDAAVDLTAYRIVQEGLTNVLKHAGPSQVHVTVRYLGDALEIEVADTGRGPAGGRGGYGLAGLRERVALLGGALETGAAEGGGHVLRARLPLALTRA